MPLFVVRDAVQNRIAIVRAFDGRHAERLTAGHLGDVEPLSCSATLQLSARGARFEVLAVAGTAVQFWSKEPEDFSRGDPRVKSRDMRKRAYEIVAKIAANELATIRDEQEGLDMRPCAAEEDSDSLNERLKREAIESKQKLERAVRLFETVKGIESTESDSEEKMSSDDDDASDWALDMMSDSDSELDEMKKDDEDLDQEHVPRDEFKKLFVGVKRPTVNINAEKLLKEAAVAKKLADVLKEKRSFTESKRKAPDIDRDFLGSRRTREMTKKKLKEDSSS